MKVSLPQHTHLIEGVHNGFTFTFINEKGEGLHSPAQCKDYFQDLFWSEYNGKPASVYGFTWKPGMLDKDAKQYRMALQEKGTDLIALAPQLLGFLHHFEGAQGFEYSAVHATTQPDTVVLEFDARWSHSAPMISAFTSIVRLGFTYPGGDVMEYLAGLQAVANPEDWRKKSAAVHRRCLPDAQRLKTIGPRINAVLNGVFPTLPYSEISTAGGAHNTGIVGWSKFPEVK
jgi:hypothetical protein